MSRGKGLPYVVGLTGGIGSGKSAVADAFAARGIDVTDTDRLAHELTVPGAPGLAAIVAALGPGWLQPDGALDRAALRRRAFADASVRARLEGALHPLIGAAARDAVARWTSPYGILVVPLLLERGGLASVVSRVLVVDCPEDEQVRRVRLRSGLAEAEVRAIMATQLGRAERLARADDVLDNSGPPSAIPPQVAALDRRYRELAAEAGRAPSSSGRMRG
ncbi:MAG TPA: dephospho-CoA kinase [Casimicrobiaceae bacterium]|nr:dephospho-CoA kinase [Casimicrobiaceae bacterium]